MRESNGIKLPNTLVLFTGSFMPFLKLLLEVGEKNDNHARDESPGRETDLLSLKLSLSHPHEQTGFDGVCYCYAN